MQYDNFLNLEDLAKELEELKVEEENDPLAFNSDLESRERLNDLLALDSTLSGLEDQIQEDSQAISESYFSTYAQELADDLGYTGGGKEKDNPLLDYIDWDAWAKDLKMDYTEFDFDGGTWLIRSR